MAAKIKVNYLDNELILIATTPALSSTVAHLKSGYYADTPFQLDARTILAPGEYTLQMIGINWGSPGRFDVEVNGQRFQWNSSGEQAVDSRTVSITV